MDYCVSNPPQTPALAQIRSDMKTIHAKFFSAIAILSATVLLSGGSAQTASTVPVGFMTYTLTTGTTSSFGVPLMEVSTFSGLISAAGTNTISATGVAWTTNQFATAGNPYFVTIKTGAQAGRTLLVTANDATTLTLDVEDTNLDASGFAVVAATDTFELFQGDTLATLFGATADGSGLLASGIKGGANAFTADGVQFYNGIRFVTYFFNTTLGTWVMSNGGNTSQNNFILYPDEGMLITRRGPSTTLTVTGRVPSTGLKTKLPSGGVTSTVSVRFPTDTTLAGLNFTGPGVWITGANAFVADTVSIWNGIKWNPYFKNASGQWIKVNGDGSDQSSTVIPAGAAVQILKRGSATGSATFFSQALPYSL